MTPNAAAALAHTPLAEVLRALLSIHGDAEVRETLDQIAFEDAPYVCAGCHAVGGHPHAPGCLDAEIEARDLETLETITGADLIAELDALPAHMFSSHEDDEESET